MSNEGLCTLRLCFPVPGFSRSQICRSGRCRTTGTESQRSGSPHPGRRGSDWNSPASASHVLDTGPAAFILISCTSGGGYYCYGHWMDKDTELREVNNLPQVTQLGRDRARIRPRDVCFQRPLPLSSLEAPCSPPTSLHHLTPCPWHLLRHSCAPRRSTGWHRWSMHTCPMGRRAKSHSCRAY